MTGSLIIVGFFFLGCLLGWSGLMPAFLQNEDLTIYVLYLLMFQVGLSIGSDKQLKEILTNIRPKLLLVPLATITGTLLFSALISFFLSRWSVTDCLAVGSGFAYYSLSSRERFRLLFPFHHFDYPVEGAGAWRSDGGRAGDDSPDEQYLP